MANLRDRGVPIVIISLIVALLSLAGIQAQASPEEYVPVKSVVYRPSSSVLPPAMTTTTTVMEAVSYEPFELCQGCRCCSSSNGSSCVDTSCCYAIDCDLPGKPFGTCAFTPHTCSCSGAATNGNCTQPS